MDMTKLFSSVVAAIVLSTTLSAEQCQKKPLDKYVDADAQAAASPHRTRQTRPIQLGVSGGSTVDYANNACCSGTLGSLVKDAAGTLYILSNTHVLAGDSATGGNNKISTKGDPINQPGYIDVGCNKNSQDYVGTLEKWVTIVPNGITSVDAAIAKTNSQAVNSQGKILDIGTISSTPRAAFVGQSVKKSGRTSGLTTGQVKAINATISVEYTTECGGTPYTTTYKNQILVTPGNFLRGGDSGSLLVENIASNPRPIGLLFAGSSTVAVANPIQDVLNALQVSFVGKPTATKLTNFEKVTSDAFTVASLVQERHSDRLMQVKGVIGHGLSVSQDNARTPCILVLVANGTNDMLPLIPQQLDGVPVEIMEIGPVSAY